MANTIHCYCRGFKRRDDAEAYKDRIKTRRWGYEPRRFRVDEEENGTFTLHWTQWDNCE